MARPRATPSDEPSVPTAPKAEGAPVKADAPGPAARDVVLVGPPTDDGGGFHVLRARDERLEAGELRTLQEGKPIAGEVLSLKPRADNPRICDVTSSFAPAASAGRKGPAQVATDRYRDRWEEIFARKSEDPDTRALN